MNAFVSLAVSLGVGLGLLYVLACAWMRWRHPAGYVEIPPEFRTRLYDLTAAVDDVFRTQGIPYWVESGTLIGVMRHADFIPWDDDVDLFVSDEHDPAIRASVDLLRQRGLVLHPYEFGWKIGVAGDPFEADKGLSPLGYFIRLFRRSRYPYVDIFLKKRQGDLLRFTSTVWDRNYPRHSPIAVNEVFPLRRYPFGPISVSGPADPLPYLERAFGNWQDGVVTWGHHLPRIYHAFGLFMRRRIPAAELESKAPARPV